MRASFAVSFALAGLLAACTADPDDGIHGVMMDGAASEAGGCALGGCMHGMGPDLGVDGEVLDDGGSFDAGFTCQAPSSTNRVSPVTGNGLSNTFVVQAVWADWNSTTTCTAPVLDIALTDSTFCGDPNSQEIHILFPTAPALVPSTTLYMLNTMAAQAIQVYYRPPSTVPVGDQGAVGPCALSGTITFDSLRWPGNVTGTITSADLYPCATSTTPPMPTWTIDASFDVPVATAAPTCP